MSDVESVPVMKSAVYRRYLLTVLLVIFAFNQMDRFALGLMLQSIKVDLQLTDTQLGLLTGIAFALFYSVLGIPIARWADRGNRVMIISITTAVWSAALALCGVAANFIQLLLIRIGVAVGEAGTVPPAHSLIADHFTRAERPRALARYMLGIPLSSVIGYLAAGWLNQLYGWRLTFILLALPGLAVAAVAWFTLRDPRCGTTMPESVGALATTSLSLLSARSGKPAVQVSFRDVATTLRANITFCHLLLCWSLISFFGHGLWQWKPTYFIRSFGLGTREVGNWFAAIYGLGALIGLYLGGELASRRAGHNESKQLKVIAITYCALAVIQAGVFVAPNPYLSFGLLALSTIGLYGAHGPIFAAIQTLVPPCMRAMAVATIYLFANLIGMGLGPLAAGALSDALRPTFGQESLRYALLSLCSGYLWASWHLWHASTTITRDLQFALDVDRHRHTSTRGADQMSAAALTNRVNTPPE